MGVKPKARASLAAAALLAAWAALGPPAQAQDAMRLRQQRWAEDWRGASTPLKDMDLGSGLRLSLGADARWKVEGIDAPRLGFADAQADSWLTQRLLAHADLHVGTHARVFAQLGSHWAFGRQVLTVADDDRLDLNQGFVDLAADLGATRATLRVGRQEMELGSPRFITLRDPTNLRPRYDQALLILEGADWRADLFAGRPTNDRPGEFDDRPDPRQEFAGVRLQRQLGAVTARLLYYELSRDDFRIGDDVGHDHRRSFGGHVLGRAGDYDFDVELLRQTGRYGVRRVSALGGAIDAGRTFPGVWLTPRMGARLTYGSGDSHPTDGRQQTFTPPFPGAWFGQNGLASFSNAVEAAATLRILPRPDLTISFKAGTTWRADAGDYVYVGNATALPGTRTGGAHVAEAASVGAQWRISPHVTWSGYVSGVLVTRELRDLGAHNIVYANSSLAFSY